MQLRLVIAEAVTRFKIGFATPEAKANFINNVKDRFTWKLAKLELEFTPL